ncbi:lipoprotein-releasing system ATP-binding protein [Flavobacterium micromati]|jgi:lipoprotein-releasing system ATP-binding protein|uniref:Lipoprotein-releasing system ATP-binding protein n=1 Tax=Flavobacterium micromati TaxID=229205 RepID=A0A1M5HXL1_9FLAO|nr:ABC transporter ATP-binding protein [Flavobacterium micromati]MCL6462289.1 ABC transporter ATP-binding protein [Flavobacterium micromati]SHG20627.1 lipoprotein-releasing system ATP-binding protein [Flavobacterium micromati]
MEKSAILQTVGLSKYFYDPVKFKVLNEIDLSIKHGEFVSIIGKSGCGKSTLLYLLSTMDTDYEGQILIDDELMTGKTDRELAIIRNEKIGFVFQFHYLLAEYSVLKNVMLPGMKLGKYSNAELEHRAMEHLKTLDMGDQALKMTNQLSGGQKQRVAIARALINDPVLIMGDEPTGNLDKKNSDLVFDIFKKLTQVENQTLLVVTHDTDFAERTQRIITMEDGKIIS